MTPNFETFDNYSLKFLQRAASEIDRPGDLESAYRETRALFHVLRDAVDVETSEELVGQIPDRIKDLYVDGWDKSKERSRFEKTEDFYNELRAKDGENAAQDFPDDAQARQAVQGVFAALSEPARQSALNRIKERLPKPLQDSVKG